MWYEGERWGGGKEWEGGWGGGCGETEREEGEGWGRRRMRGRGREEPKVGGVILIRLPGEGGCAVEVARSPRLGRSRNHRCRTRGAGGLGELRVHAGDEVTAEGVDNVCVGVDAGGREGGSEEVGGGGVGGGGVGVCRAGRGGVEREGRRAGVGRKG